MDKEIFNDVEERLEKVYQELTAIELKLKRGNVKFSALDNIINRLDEAIQRWQGRA